MVFVTLQVKRYSLKRKDAQFFRAALCQIKRQVILIFVLYCIKKGYSFQTVSSKHSYKSFISMVVCHNSFLAIKVNFLYHPQENF